MDLEEIRISLWALCVSAPQTKYRAHGESVCGLAKEDLRLITDDWGGKWVLGILRVGDSEFVCCKGSDESSSVRQVEPNT